MPDPRPAQRKQPSQRLQPSPRPSAPPEIVDPVWLLKALALTIVAALVCAWLTACLLVYQGEWQLVLHPDHAVDRTPAAAGLSYTDIRFDAAETGTPRLTAWWIPADSQARYAAYTVLYLHDGSGSLAGTIPALARLHQAGLNIFAIDYRGFGASDATEHPNAARMAQDTAAALDYLTATRHIPAHQIVPYGTGLGASLAVGLAQAHPELPAVVLDNPDPDPASTAVAAHPSHVLPVRLLFGSQFNIAAPLATLATPKLLIAGGPNSNDSNSNLQLMQSLFQSAASPRFTITLSPGSDEDNYQSALTRFLDQNLPAQSIPTQ